MAGFAERYIGAFRQGTQDGQQAKVDETIQKFGTLASQGDPEAVDQIYGVDPQMAAGFEDRTMKRDQFIQEEAAKTAHMVLTAPPEQRQQRLVIGIDYMGGLTRRDPRFKPVIDGWRQKLQSGDMPGIESELNAVLERTMGFKDKYANTKGETATERALKVLYPDNPQAQARAQIEMEAGKDRFVSTPQGTMVIPGRMPSGMPGAPAAAAPPAGAKPFASYTGGQQPAAGPRPSSAPGYADGPVVPNGGYIIRDTQRPLDAGTKEEIRESTKAIDNLNISEKLLTQALALNDSASSGEYLETRSGLGAQMGFQSSKDAQVMSNLLLRNVLPQLKSSFGGSPTEGERAILIQIETAMEQPPDVRRQIIETAMELLQLRRDNAKKLVSGMQSGDIYRGDAPAAGTDVTTFSNAIEAPPPAPPAPVAAPAPRGLPMVGEGGRPIAGPAPASPDQIIGQFRRSELEAYARKHGLTLEQALTAQTAKKMKILQQQEGQR